MSNMSPRSTKTNMSSRSTKTNVSSRSTETAREDNELPQDVVQPNYWKDPTTVDIQTLNAEELRSLVQCLNKEVSSARLRRQATQLQNEIRTLESESHAESTRFQFERKRNHDDQEDVPRLRMLELYSGESLAEYEAFIGRAEMWFSHYAEFYEKHPWHKIAEALDNIDQKEFWFVIYKNDQGGNSWEDFKLHLREICVRKNKIKRIQSKVMQAITPEGTHRLKSAFETHRRIIKASTTKAMNDLGFDFIEDARDLFKSTLSSISSCGPATCAPSQSRLVVTATRRCAAMPLKECQKNLSIHSPIDETSLGGVCVSPETEPGLCGTVRDMKTREAAQGLCELSGALRQPRSPAVNIDKNRLCRKKDRHPRSIRRGRTDGFPSTYDS